ncbi:hypothetical protein EUX98_g1661 [Antrodiella citrinella]|uniref:Initiator tRNA phosphoribosyl transferase n=1 Tax=Antrodiella citrinella TaxID=2447956 RepID=A0A4S4N3U7_9APHY|nr:hypothetical protein EUX98_g1661 [Antrodiella citrinella]
MAPGLFTHHTHTQDGHIDDQADALALLRKESLDIFNRIHSIAEDVLFVEVVGKAYPGLPVLRTEFAVWGLASPYAAYFKSTDGHYNNWSFSLRRPNIHLLPVVVQHGGLILVDSTRAGKRMPDALSKTVPVWCAVINRAVRKAYSKGEEWNEKLYTPPGVVPPQEHAQIEALVEEWAEALVNSSYTLPDLAHPLRPLWITPATSVFPALPPSKSEGRKFYPVICVSASKQILVDGLDRRSNGFAYVQGSGDDHELWGMGLTPQMFWREKDQLLEATRSDLPERVAEIVAKHRSERRDEWVTHPTSVTKSGGGRLLISAVADLPLSLSTFLPHPDSDDAEGRYLAHVVISDKDTLTSFTLSSEERKDVLLLELAAGKKGQAGFLNVVLPQAIAFIGTQLAAEGGSRDVCVSCHSGKDVGVGVVLAALQVFFDDEGEFRSDDETSGEREIIADKQSLATRLQWIISDRPEANPSRATLKRVNEFLLTSPALRR